jgi:ABC-type sugar transport system ATPase subunit/branched-subunit amino acid ABC-type transport system permease component
MQLSAHDICKSYGSTVALDHVPLVLRPGEVHALVGENGAGKSTLLKIAAGAEQPDSGALALDGVPYRPHSLHAAQRSGVALVFQEVTINTSLTVAENIFIDRLRDFTNAVGLVDRGRLERRAQEILDSLDAGISVRENLAALDLGKWKCIEIARALSYEPRVLLLDEATAFLNLQEVRAVLAAMDRLRRNGLTIGFVSHHLDEVLEVADRMSILKDGRYVGTFATGEVTIETIQSRMVGRELSASLYPQRQAAAVAPVPLLRLDGVAAEPDCGPVSLTLNRGEVLGVGGLKGAGGESLLALVAGDRAVTQGAMRLDGAPYRPRAPVDAWQAAVAYLPGDRTAEGLLLDFSVLDNLVLSAQPHRGPFFDRPAATSLAQRLMQQLRIKAATPWVRCGDLSGGNLQKVVLLVSALGMTFVIVAGSIDLSVGSIVGLAALTAAVTSDSLGVAALVPSCAVGLAAGLLNGIVIAKGKVPSFIVTMGAMVVYRGVILFWTRGAPISINDEAFLDVYSGRSWGVPHPAMIALVLVALAHVALNYTVFGRELRAVGAGERVAVLTGIRVPRVKITMFALLGLMCGMAGLLQGARTMAATAQLGEGLELDVIAAVVVGGTPLTGGIGTIGGTILGALIITILPNGMNMIGVDPYVQNIVKGLVLVGAVFVTIDRAKIGIIK